MSPKESPGPKHVRLDSYTKKKSKGALCTLHRELLGVPGAQQREVELVHGEEVREALCRLCRKLAGGAEQREVELVHEVEVQRALPPCAVLIA